MAVAINDEIVGGRLRGERSARGLSLQQVADRLIQITGDSRWTNDRLSRMERGAMNVRYVDVVHFAEAIGIPFEQLVSRISDDVLTYAGVAQMARAADL